MQDRLEEQENSHQSAITNLRQRVNLTLEQSEQEKEKAKKALFKVQYQMDLVRNL